jgi:hypothetical protein
MRCPHCHETLPSLSCLCCGGENPEKSLYCCWCGSRMEKEEETDFSGRILCSDGSCIGVLNEVGVCNICGKPLTREQG